MIVAEITKDHVKSYNTENEQLTDYEGKEFHSEAMQDWWGWDDRVPIDTDELPNLPKTQFKLYDDDDELYYEGWLLNDDGCLVQQFVLAWATADSGCTYILVYKDEEAGYIQEIA